MGRELGITDDQLRELSRYRESDAFDDIERLVVDLAVHLTAAPIDVPQQLMTALARHFSEAQLVELVAGIAWENYRGRFNRAFGVRATGFADGAVCVLPHQAPHHATQ